MPQKLKSLLPSLKEKKRYLVFEIISDKPIKSPLEELTKKINELLGIYDSARASILPITYSEKTKKGIIKISNTEKDKVIGTLAFIKDIQKTDAIIKPLFLTGIIDRAKQKI